MNRLPDQTSAPVKATISQHQVSDATAESLFCLATWCKILTSVKKEPLELRFWKKLIHLAWLYLYFLCEYNVTFLFKNLKTHLVVEGKTWFLACVTEVCLQHMNLYLEEARGAVTQLFFFQNLGCRPSSSFCPTPRCSLQFTQLILNTYMLTVQHILTRPGLGLIFCLKCQFINLIVETQVCYIPDSNLCG